MRDAFIADRSQTQIEPFKLAEPFEILEIGVRDLRAVQIDLYDFAIRIVLDLTPELLDLRGRAFVTGVAFVRRLSRDHRFRQEFSMLTIFARVPGKRSCRR